MTYSNKAKMELLGVPEATIAAHGAISAETAAAMAQGAVARAGVDLAVAIVGIAGPGGGTLEKPIGIVHFGVGKRDGCRSEHRIFPGDRSEIRQQALVLALELLLAEARRAG